MEKQKSQYTVIIVDNDSKQENKDQIVEWMQQKDSYYIAEKRYSILMSLRRIRNSIWCLMIGMLDSPEEIMLDLEWRIC